METLRSIHTRQILLYGLVVWMAFAGLGCGSNKVPAGGGGRSDLSSRSSDVNDSGTGYTNSGAVAECNQFKLSDYGLTGQLSTYYQSSQLVLDYINLNLSDVPDVILTTSNHYIQIFRWHEDIPGHPVHNTQPVQMFFVQRGTGKKIAEDAPVDVLSKATIQNLITKYSLNSNGITVSNFFDTHLIVLKGMDITYDAITVALYDHSQGSQAYAWVDALLPAFTANPNGYANEHKSTTLRNLHPMYDRRNSGMSDSAFKQEIEKACLGML